MYFSKAITVLVLSSAVIGAPILKRQGAGVGAGCDSILTDGDTGSGLAVKEAGTNAASFLKSAGAKRQGAGVGAACNSILTDGDTGSGLAVKEAGQNSASLISSTTAGAAVPAVPAVPAAPKVGRRQLDKAGAGTAALIGLVSPDTAATQEGITNEYDGYGTTESAVIGEQIGESEVATGVAAGNLVPSSGPSSGSGSSSPPSSDPSPPPPKKGPKTRRQLDKAGAGTAALIGLASPDTAATQEGITNEYDGYGTTESAVLGAQIGASEAATGVAAGNLVPASAPQAGQGS